MKKIYLLTSLILLGITTIQAQYICGGTDDNQEIMHSEKSEMNCNRAKPINGFDTNLLLYNFIPNDTTPIITLKVNVNVWREDNGMGNYWKDTSTYRDTLQQLFDWVNYIFSNNIPYSHPVDGAPFIPDTKIRVEIDTVYYYDNTELAYKAGNNYYISYIRERFPERLSNYNYHFVLNQTANYAGASNGYSAIYHSAYSVREAETNIGNLMQARMYGFAKHIVHEICHNFGLDHTYNSDITAISHYDFLWDVFGTEKQSWCESPPTHVCYHQGGWACDPYDTTNTCTNNMMGGSQHSGHFSALQCAKLHRALTIGTIKKHAHGYHSIPIAISNNQTWDYSRKLYQDIVIKSGVTLTILCTLEMVSQAKIIVEPGGKLIIDGGILTNACDGELWQGIEVLGNENLRQNATSQGIVELKNGARIENAICGIYVGERGSSEKGGGIVYAQNTTFINNKQAVCFAPYLGEINQTSIPPNNKSYFTHCEFLLDNASKNSHL